MPEITRDKLLAALQTAAELSRSSEWRRTWESLAPRIHDHKAELAATERQIEITEDTIKNQRAALVELRETALRLDGALREIDDLLGDVFAPLRAWRDFECGSPLEAAGVVADLDHDTGKLTVTIEGDDK